MKYKNVRTGNVINVKSGFSGKDWVPVRVPASEKPAKAKVAPVQQPKKSKKKKNPVDDWEDEEE